VEPCKILYTYLKRNINITAFDLDLGVRGSLYNGVEILLTAWRSLALKMPDDRL
jgi:hypothetical protein